MKKLFAILLILIITIAALPFNASAVVLIDDKYVGDPLVSENLKYTILSGEAIITDYVKEPVGELVIPESINGHPVTSIERHAFVNCSQITSVILPEGLKEIGYDAFEDCTSLESINIPSTVTEIDGSFLGCKALSDVYITNLSKWCQINFKFDKANPLVYAKNLYLNNEKVDFSNFVIPNGITRIGDGLFCDVDHLTGITIPSSVRAIGDRAFMNCTGLKNVYISDLRDWCSIDFDYSSNPLAYADNLYVNGVEVGDNLVIPEGVLIIKPRAFVSFDSITSVTFSSTVTFIKDIAFYNCRGLTSITIPDTVHEIGQSAFENCTSLKSATLSSNLTEISDSLFEECTSLESIVIPDGVTTIGERAFLGCSSLEQITLPEGLEAIDDGAFWDCKSLVVAKIPGSVTAIGDYAFRNCEKLEDVNVPEGATIGELAFQGCDGLDKYLGQLPPEIKEPNSASSIIIGLCGAAIIAGIVIFLVVRKRKSTPDKQ